MRGEGRYDGVFGIWYGKGPGVDRTGDVFRHANFDGSSKHGGVIALMGDDHTCESSTTAHQSEFAFLDAMMPILNPAGVQEILDYGLTAGRCRASPALWVGAEMHQGLDRIDGGDRRLARPRALRAAGHRHAAGRAQHPAGPARAGEGGAAAPLEEAGGARLHPREQARPDHDGGRAEAAARHRLARQELARHAAGARSARHRREARRRSRPPALQGRGALAARAGGRQPLRRGAGDDPRRRGEALAGRDAGQGAALRPRRRARW